MAVYSVTQKYLLDNYAVLQSLTPTEIAVGQSITVASVDATFDGTFTVRALPQYLYIGIDTEGDLLYDINVPIPNQVIYAKTASNVERTAATGTITYTQTCTWVICRAANYIPWRTDHRPIGRLHADYSGCISWQSVLLPSPPRSWLHRQSHN
jgi:hypothetical protein